MSRSWDWIALLVIALCVCDRAAAQCPLPTTYADTGKQNCGLAPRFDLELALHVGAALGDPCLQSGDTRSCGAPGIAMGGGQIVAGFRLWRRVAIGLVGAYDKRIGSTAFGDDDVRADYSSDLWRVMFELRWYSRGVAAGGLFLAFRAGAAWMTDTASPRDQDLVGASETQAAPVVGAGIGGVFTPYQGLGMTIALQSFIATFPNIGPALPRGLGSAYGYGDLIFLGVTFGAILGVGL